MGDAVEAADGRHILLNSINSKSLLSLLFIIIGSGCGGVYITS